MAKQFHVNTLLLSGQAITANSTTLFVNGNAVQGGTVGGGGVSGVTVTGSAGFSGVFNLATGSGIALGLSGNTVTISINPTNLTTLSGIGGTQIITSGNFLLVSGGAGGPINTGGFVDVSSDQFISGRKVFQQDIRVSGYVGINNGYPIVSLDVSGSGRYSIANGGTNDIDILLLQNVTLATLAVPSQQSPCLNFSGNVWSTSNNSTTGINWRLYGQGFSGNPPYSQLRFDSLIGTGTVYNEGVIVLNSSGVLLGVSGMFSSGLTITGSPVFTFGQTGLLANAILSSVTGFTYITGSGITQSLYLSSSLIFSGQSGDISNKSSLTDAELYNKTIAGRPMVMCDTLLGNPYPYGPVMWSKLIQNIMPGSAGVLTSIGVQPCWSGYISHYADAMYGYGAVFTTTGIVGGPPGTYAGVCQSGTGLFRGPASTISGMRNGFFVACRFALPDNTGLYITGISSGVRMFIGVTDRWLSDATNSTVPTGCRAGFSFIRSSGGPLGGANSRNDSNFQFVTCDNTGQTVTDTTIPFNSGAFQAFVYMPPSPNTSLMYWRLEDYSRGYYASGAVSTTLPIPCTPMRALAGLQSVSGIKSFRLYSLYSEV